MNILFAAGDVGGARVLLPVARLAVKLGHQVSALAHGKLQQEGSVDWRWLLLDEARREAFCTDIVIYATSVSDTAAVEVATAARTAGKPCLHLLDNWSSYLERINLLLPDVYAVMDDLAFTEAKAAGIPASILHITGHPDLEKLDEEQVRLPGPTESPSILFVSEPAAIDGGVGSRGYDEIQVTEQFILALTAVTSSRVTLRVAPHPRENRDAVDTRMDDICTRLPGAPDWSLVPAQSVRSALHSASHVVGMSSILLYEAWLLGRPTLSLQPGLLNGKLRALSHRQGLIFHETLTGMEESIATWLDRTPGPNTKDLVKHQNAALAVLSLAERSIANHIGHLQMPAAQLRLNEFDVKQPTLKQEKRNAT